MANYADIINIEAPSGAIIGSQVEVKVYVRNLASVVTGIMVGGAIENSWMTVSFPNNYTNFEPGQTYYFTGYFNMPSTNAKVHIYSYWYSDDDGAWHFDDTMTKDVSVVSVWKQLDTMSISILTSATWKKLSSIMITIVPTAVWKKLDSGTITVSSTISVWKKLATSSLTIKPSIPVPPPIPPPVPNTCSVDSDCPEGYVCENGKCVKKETESNWLIPALVAGGLVLMTTMGGKKEEEHAKK